MAQIEMNALSVITGGSFSARIFSPEMNRLSLVRSAALRLDDASSATTSI